MILKYVKGGFMSSIHDFSVTTIDGQNITLEDYKGQTLLIVNVASECGFTNQYEGLQALYEEFKDKGFQVLGFPCNQFGGQEPGSDEEVKNFCSTKFNVSFPMFSKVEVNGENAHPLFQHLKQNSPGVLGSEAIKWNFTKFLVNKNGEVLQRYAPTKKPEELKSDIKKLIEQ